MENIKPCGSILDQYFGTDTMSIHIKEGLPIIKKGGGPGDRKPTLSKDDMSKAQLNELITKVFQEVEERDDSYMEIDRPMSKVVQLAVYRIVISYPPLSDGLEMTVVKPIKKLNLADYDLDTEIIDFLHNQSKGILISGAPGSGKTTFAQALVEVYSQDNSIIKTIESPRDLLVPDQVVQYSFTYASHDELRDILLLSRPDFTVYDEVRNKPDFELYKDLRLTGIGLIGAIHATKPIDSIQRFLGTIELGIIPQVLDTVIFIDKGTVAEILQLKLVVKVPSGMMSDDLARPIVVVSSFLSKEDQYEIYTFGEQIVVVPLGCIEEKSGQNAVAEYAKDTIDRKLSNYLDTSFISKVVGSDKIKLYVPSRQKAVVIGRAGKNIISLEKNMGMKINVDTIESLAHSDIQTTINKNNNTLIIGFPPNYAERDIHIFTDGEIYNFRTDENSNIVIKKNGIVKAINKTGFIIINQEAI